MADPIIKVPEIKHFLETMSQLAFGRSRCDSIEGDICIACENPAPPDSFRDDRSRKEFALSAMCQVCQDDIFGVEEDA